MRRAVALGAVIAFGALSMSVRVILAAAQGPAPGQLTVEKLRDNLFILKTADPANESGGNTAVFIQSNGVTVVDTKNPGWGAPVLARIKELTSKPVTRIINTHAHGDHVSGNVEFPATVDVVTQLNTQENMKRLAIFGESSGRGLPKRTFTDRMTIDTGADQIELRYFGRGHTNGDAWVIFPALRVVHTGDIFARKGLLFLDGSNGGSGVEVPDTLAKAAEALGNIEAIITGHSTVMTVADLREFAEFNREFVNSIRDAKRAGRTVDEVEAAWALPEKYKGYDPARTRLRGNIELIYKELQ
ncbi:MAG TPA: MBL fold metallo-hydrolase [Vicinamibacterales bacterium]|nr:MBL fold metallo-hydrolase [Vicinamibacterales bacterium]